MKKELKERLASYKTAKERYVNAPTHLAACHWIEKAHAELEKVCELLQQENKELKKKHKSLNNKLIV